MTIWSRPSAPAPAFICGRLLFLLLTYWVQAAREMVAKSSTSLCRLEEWEQDGPYDSSFSKRLTQRRISHISIPPWPGFIWMAPIPNWPRGRGTSANSVAWQPV